MTFSDDPVGTVRRSSQTGAVLIRVEAGWLSIPQSGSFAYHYEHIGGWDGDDTRWPEIKCCYVGGRSS